MCFCYHVGCLTKVMPGSSNRWRLRQPKNFCICASQGAPKGPPGYCMCKKVLAGSNLSVSQSIFRPESHTHRRTVALRLAFWPQSMALWLEPSIFIYSWGVICKLITFYNKKCLPPYLLPQKFDMFILSLYNNGLHIFLFDKVINF